MILNKNNLKIEKILNILTTIISKLRHVSILRPAT